MTLGGLVTNATYELTIMPTIAIDAGRRRGCRRRDEGRSRLAHSRNRITACRPRRPNQFSPETLPV